MAIEVTTENPGSENPASENSNPTNPTSTVQDQRWVIGQWLVSRLWIWFGFFGIAPQLAAQSPDAIATADLSSLIRWDSTHYLSIVASGYTYSGDNNIGTIAFFPLYPLLIKVGSAIGLTPLVAGFLISNLCFLAGLWVLHDWVPWSDRSSLDDRGNGLAALVDVWDGALYRRAIYFAECLDPAGLRSGALWPGGDLWRVG
jgi:Mannosyltransferase (PIG-V)